MQKLTEEELKTLSDLQQEYTQLAQARGQLEFAKRRLEQDIQEVEQQYEAVQTREAELAEQLSVKYGVGTVNLESGEFISQVTS